jgi:hypothetical protein
MFRYGGLIMYLNIAFDYLENSKTYEEIIVEIKYPFFCLYNFCWKNIYHRQTFREIRPETHIDRSVKSSLK